MRFANLDSSIKTFNNLQKEIKKLSIQTFLSTVSGLWREKQKKKRKVLKLNYIIFSQAIKLFYAYTTSLLGLGSG
jgi:hypothetical protein